MLLQGRKRQRQGQGQRRAAAVPVVRSPVRAVQTPPGRGELLREPPEALGRPKADGHGLPEPTGVRARVHQPLRFHGLLWPAQVLPHGPGRPQLVQALAQVFVHQGGGFHDFLAGACNRHPREDHQGGGGRRRGRGERLGEAGAELPYLYRNANSEHRPLLRVPALRVGGGVHSPAEQQDKVRRQPRPQGLLWGPQDHHGGGEQEEEEREGGGRRRRRRRKCRVTGKQPGENGERGQQRRRHRDRQGSGEDTPEPVAARRRPKVAA
mmetsp:Transcript_8704/g.17467  ORF Transcript_8704/g.17467 Transcript_8704/m.17467 type:complete len:266 (-) Transcript_8704:94-891(-)